MSLFSAMSVKQPRHVHRRQVLSTADRIPSPFHRIWRPYSAMGVMQSVTRVRLQHVRLVCCFRLLKLFFFSVLRFRVVLSWLSVSLSANAKEPFLSYRIAADRIGYVISHRHDPEAERRRSCIIRINGTRKRIGGNRQ